jgi:cyclic pyranopterin monophosphate synthase
MANLNKRKFLQIDNKSGKVRMIDVSDKKKTLRTARASGKIILNEEIISKISSFQMKKGDVINTAKIAGINAAKKTWELIPLCHQIQLTDIEIDIRILKPEHEIIITSIVRGYDRTGVEMEALTAVSAALLTVYDMSKALSKNIIISDVKLIEKTGGKSDFKKE